MAKKKNRTKSAKVVDNVKRLYCEVVLKNGNTIIESTGSFFGSFEQIKTQFENYVPGELKGKCELIVTGGFDRKIEI